MTNNKWDQWAEFYASAFGFRGEDDAKMFKAWREVFEASGYSAAELNEAARFVAGDPPKFRNEHLSRLHERIRQRRFQAQVARERSQEIEQGYLPCNFCGGTAWAVVPHLKSVVQGEWQAPWYTFAVACSCHKGVTLVDKARAARQEWEDKKKDKHVYEPKVPMRLEDYERLNPRWFEQLGLRAVAVEAQLKASTASLIAEKEAIRFREGLARIVSKTNRLVTATAKEKAHE